MIAEKTNSLGDGYYINSFPESAINTEVMAKALSFDP